MRAWFRPVPARPAPSPSDDRVQLLDLRVSLWLADARTHREAHGCDARCPVMRWHLRNARELVLLAGAIEGAAGAVTARPAEGS